MNARTSAWSLVFSFFSCWLLRKRSLLLRRQSRNGEKEPGTGKVKRETAQEVQKVQKRKKSNCEPETILPPASAPLEVIQWYLMALQLSGFIFFVNLEACPTCFNEDSVFMQVVRREFLSVK